jgi:predicted MFS family arabinose efflux permease
LNRSPLESSKYRYYLLILLLLILAFNYVDRAALGLLLQDIKTDLMLSDTQLGFLTGIAFALFYSVMGIPIARWADRGNRVSIISVTCALWSVAVALCGCAVNFPQLLFIRVGVGVGEAGCIPPAHSLIADYFSRAERPRAAAIYLLGGPLSVVIGFSLAGWLNEFYGWRTTFMLLSLPGIVLAALARLTLREPRLEIQRRSVSISVPESVMNPQTEASVREVFQTLWANKTFVHLLLAFSIMYFFGYGIWQWMPAFLIRSHGIKTGEIGTWFAAIWGGCGLLGTYAGGGLTSRYASHNEHLQLRVMAIVVASFAVLSPWMLLARDRSSVFEIMGVVAVGWRMTDGPLFGTIQTLVPPRMRAMSIAIVMLTANFIGLGLGPLAVGALSDAFRVWAGEDSLRYALLALCPGYLWAGWHLSRGSKTVSRDLEAGQWAVGKI